MNRHSVPNAVLGFPGRPVNGGSNPRFYQFDDDVIRLVKWHPSRHGPKACYNELVASRLGQLVGAPILRGLVVYVPDEIIPDDHRAIGAVPGFHFAVTRMQGGNFVPADHYDRIENSSQLPIAAAFLAWLSVGDQEGHNQFLQEWETTEGEPRRTARFKLIDMGQMFGTWSWNAASLTAHDSYRLPVHLAAKLKADSLRMGTEAVQVANEEGVRECFADCPEEWNVPVEDRNAGADVALRLRTRVEDIIKQGNPALR